MLGSDEMAKTLGPAELLHGSLASLENSARLSEDAKLLFTQGRFASAITLATFAREELGRCKLIHDQFKKIDPHGSILVDELNALCDDHVKKLHWGQSITLVPLSETKLARLRNAAESDDAETRKAIMADVDVALKAKRKRDPHTVHKRREQSLYADALPDGRWNRPNVATEEEARVLIHIVCSEYSNTILAFFNNATLRVDFERHSVRLDLARLQASMVSAMLLPSAPNIS
jgi:AbiV family abortive infection protein